MPAEQQVLLPMPRQRLRIFISSPGNVGPERARAREVVEQIAKQYEKSIQLETYFWEEYSFRSDDNYVNQIPEAMTYDAVVCVVWDTVGETPIPLHVRRRPGSDEPYESGTVYEFETARAEARRTGGRPALYVFRKFATLDWPSGQADIVAKKKASYDRLEAFWSKWFRHEDGTVNSAFMRFGTLDEFAEKLHETLTDDWLGGLLEIRRGTWDVLRDGSPFPGLVPFEAAYRRVFCGRDAAIARVTGWLQDAAERGAPTFFLIRGASGSGKSSLVRAGVQPLLTGHSAAESWGSSAMLPGMAPLVRLAEAVCAALPLPFHGGAPVLEAILRGSPAAAALQVDEILRLGAEARRKEEKRDAAVRGRLFLLIDQLEEAVASPEAELSAFALAVQALCKSGAVWAVATLRNDLESVLLESPLKLLADPGHWGGGSMPLAPPDAIADVIEGPAAIAGLTLETRLGVSLADEIRGDLAGQTDALPLLQMTLARLFELDIHGDARTRTLTLDSYQSIGRLQGAIASKADEVVKKLPPGQEAELDRLLGMLVQGTSPAQQVVSSVLKLPDRDREPRLLDLIESLAGPDARLLVIEKDTARVAHEALLRTWRRAQAVAEREAKFKDLCRRLREAAGMQEIIPPGKLLEDARDHLDRLRAEGELAQEVGLVVKSLGHERRRRRLFQGASVVLGVFAVAASVGFLLAWHEGARAASGLQLALRLGTEMTAEPEREMRERAGISPAWRAAWLDPAKAGLDVAASAGLGEPGVSLLIARVNLMRAEVFRLAGDMTAAAGYVDNAAREAGQAAPAELEGRDWQAARRDMLLIKSELALARNDLSGAAAAQAAGQALASALYDDDAASIENRRALARAYRDGGNLLARQEPADAGAAEAAYQKAADLLLAYIKADPLLATDYIDAREHIADVRIDFDLPGALSIYRENAGLAEGLALVPPAWLQTSLSIAREKLADALVETRPADYEAALAFLERNVEMRRALLGQDPGNRKLSRNLGVAHYHLGYTQEQKGDLGAARGDLQAAADIFDSLRDGSDPRDRAVFDSASAHMEIGNVLAMGGECAEARSAFGLAADILSGAAPERFGDIRDELRKGQSDLEAQCRTAAR